MNIEIEDYHELLALHKMTMVVKFDRNSCLREAQGSPLTSKIAHKVFDTIILFKRAEGKHTEAQRWLNWQVADESRLETQLLRAHISEVEWWIEADDDSRASQVSDFMAPLKLEESTLDEIIRA